MAIPVVQSSSEQKEPTNSTSTTVTAPSGVVAGDVLIFVLATDGDQTDPITWPAGFTSIAEVNNGVSVFIGAAYKIAGISEPSDYTASWTDAEKAVSWIYRVDGAISGDEIQDPGESNTGNSSTATITPVASTDTGLCLVFVCHGVDDGDVTVDGGGDADYTIQDVDVSGGGGDVGAGVQTKGNLAPFVPPQCDLTLTSSEQWAAFWFVVRSVPHDQTITPSPRTIRVQPPTPNVGRVFSPSAQTIPTVVPLVTKIAHLRTLTPAALAIPITTPIITRAETFVTKYPDTVKIPVAIVSHVMHRVFLPVPVTVLIVDPGVTLVQIPGRLLPTPLAVPLKTIAPQVSVVLDKTITPTALAVPVVTTVGSVVLQQEALGPGGPGPSLLRWMPGLSSQISGLLKGCTFRFATLWRISSPQFPTIPRLHFTNHNEEIVFDGDTFEPAGGFNQSAHEAREGLKDSSFAVRGVVTSDKITEVDLRAGRWREARVKEYIVDWRWPWAGSIAEQTFWIEDIDFDADAWKAELTGITNRLRRAIGRTYEFTCQWRLGEGQCGHAGDGVDLDDITESESVTEVIKQRKIFHTSLSASFEDRWFKEGLLTWVSGNNFGLSFEVRTSHTLNGKIYLHIKTPFDIAVGDDFTVYAGCDKKQETCKDKFDNVVNFGGFDVMPLSDKVLHVPNAKRG